MSSHRPSTPATGEGGHVAPFGPRLLALLIDWAGRVAELLLTPKGTS